MIDFLTGRLLDTSAIRRRSRLLDHAAFGCIGLVAVGLILEDHTIGVANADRLVTLGVIGEFVTHWLYARATEREQHLSDAESAERQLTIARLSSEVAVANARAAEAGATAEHLRRENLELQRRIQPREIAADVRPSVVTGLARHRGQKFVIVAGASDAEGSVFAARLLDVLLAAGWMAQREGVSYGAMLELIVGVDIRVGDSPGAIAAGEALREALALAAISANVRPADRHTDSKGKVHTYPEEDALSVDVGVKPIPEMKR